MTIAPVMLRGIRVHGHPAGSAGPLVYVISILLLFALISTCVLIAWQVTRRTDRGPGDSDDGDAGGGGWGRGPSPTDPPPNADPEWWPEFERAFAAYVNAAPRPARHVTDNLTCACA